jgi:hypothetical protein
MLFYPAALPLSRQTLTYTAGSSAATARTSVQFDRIRRSENARSRTRFSDQRMHIHRQLAM